MIKEVSPKIDNNIQKGQKNATPSFKSVGSVLTTVLQSCDTYPMVGVAVVDGITAIGPRTIIDAKTNGFAAAETFRRESSGLFINCLLPSMFVYGVAKLLNNSFFNNKFKGINMAGSWANEESLESLTNIYKNTKGSERERIYDFVKKSVYSLEGLDGDAAKNGYKTFKNFDNSKLNKAINKIFVTIANPTMNKKRDKILLSQANKILIEETGMEKTIRFIGDKTNFHAGIPEFTRDISDLGKKFMNPQVNNNLDLFTKTAKKFVNTKSLVGLAIILPLAASMQSINRWITSKKSGVKGAPIYKDYTKEDTGKKMTEAQKAKFFGKKLLSAGLMIGVGLLSMMKRPSLKMFQFTGKFPTMDQCRWVSVATFASRMLASEDENELREATIRDIATFSSLYWVGDYVGKGIATIAQKINPKLKLLNNPNIIDKNAGAGKKTLNWIKDVKLKTFEEAGKYGSKNKNVRALCQVGSLGVSMILLGILLPKYVRNQTEKSRKKELEKMKINENRLLMQPNIEIPMPFKDFQSQTN